MKILHKICLSVVLVMTGLALVSEQEAFCAERGASGRGQRSRGGRRDMWSFEADKAGVVPRGWKVAETRGKGTPATWQVVEDDSAPDGTQAVAITANENRGRTYNLMIAQDTSYRDLVIRVKVKAVTGKQDQGGGPIWRAKDADNYYIARWNPLEDNFRVYYVKNGKRTQLASVDVKIDQKEWHEIEIKHVGNRIVAELDNEKLIELEDDTFTKAGMIGLWTKADAATYFDDVEIEEERDDGKAWQAVTMWEAGAKLERVIVGDIDNNGRPSEVLVLAQDGRVAVITGAASKWNVKVVWKHSGGLIGAAIGDLDTSHHGNEILVGGSGGIVEMIYPDNLQHMTVFDKGVSIHGLVIGDVMKSVPGNELVAVDNSGQAFVIYRIGKTWRSEEIFKDSGRLRDAIIADLDFNHPGNEICVVGSSGCANLLWEEGGNWEHKTIWKGARGLGRIAHGKVGTVSKDFKVVIAGDSGEAILLERGKGGWKGKTIFQDDDQLRGIAIGDVYPLSKGNEIVTFGYSKKLVVLYEKNGQWNSIVAWTDTDRAHSLACGQFDSSNTVEELVAVGYSQRATKVSLTESR